jgi:hypothetical protein
VVKELAREITTHMVEIVGSLYLVEIAVFLAGIFMLQQSQVVLSQLVGVGMIIFAMILAYRQKTANNEVFKK